MASVQLTDNSVPIGQWVDELFRLVFFQPDDILAKETFHGFISPDLTVK